MKKKIVLNKKIVIPALLILMLVVIGGVTFAYFTASVVGNESAKNTTAETGTMALEFDGTNIISLEGALPGAYHEITFSVENTGTLTAVYSIDIVDVINTFADKTDLVYSITSTNNGGSVEETIAPDVNGKIVEVAYIEPSVTQEYTLILHFKETGDNQNDNQGKVFSGMIQLNSDTYTNTLAQRLLQDNPVSKEGTNFNQGVPGGSTNFVDEIEENKNLGETKKFSLTATYRVSETYSLNRDNGSYYLDNGTAEVISEDFIGKYTCFKRALAFNDYSCKELYKIKNVEKSDEEGYIYVTVADVYNPKASSEASSGLFVTADDDGPTYYFRGMEENNYVQLGNQSGSRELYLLGENGNDPYAKYAHVSKNDFLDECQTIYDIYGYNNSEECINDMQDISFVQGDPILWRVVRINGDGTIRLVAEKGIAMEEFGDDTSEKYIGYTYDNSAPNAGDGTSSHIKTILDTWYQKTLLAYDDIIAKSTFCNDTNHSGFTTNVGARIQKGLPTLKCEPTTHTYGGKYKLKIGTLSADEVNYAGFSFNEPYATKKNYLHNGEVFWTLSPLQVSSGASTMYTGWLGEIEPTFVEGDGFIVVRPVINLKATVKLSGGDGSEQKPFIVY